jgi:hypothetical protein
MELATDRETTTYLEVLWIRQAESIVATIAKHYGLSTEQQTALRDKFVRPNDWSVNILPPARTIEK